MQYISHYESPLGTMLMACDEIGLTGLWLDGQKYYASCLLAGCLEKNTRIFEETKHWLSIYFSGREPDFMPALHLMGSPFRLEVWEILRRIPYGTVITYGEIAKEIAGNRGAGKMSARAVGGAVGHNPVSIIVPCHRVVGVNGRLTGYAGGLDKKIKLLTLEKAPVKNT